jgi:AmmeMemoRadiSam system protein B
MKLYSIFLIAIVIPTISLYVFTQEVRPIKDDVGYCWTNKQMKKFVDYLEKNEKDRYRLKTFVAGVAPHDDYLYAGRVYYPLYKSLKVKEVVIFGVTHGTVRKEIGDPKNVLILDNYDEWRGLDKNVDISPLREFIKNNLDSNCFIISNKAHELEHSIEAQIPFLQYYNPQIKITPIMVTAMPFERMDSISEKLSQTISAYIQNKKLTVGKDIVFIMSSDANHYGKDFNNIPYGEDAAAHDRGTKRDLEIAKACLEEKISVDKIKKFTEEMSSLAWCGKYSIPFGLLTVQKTIKYLSGESITGRILRYSDSYSEGVIPVHEINLGTTAPFSLKHWVGFLSAVYSIK